MSRPITVHRLGRVEYADGLELQQQHSDARRAGLAADTLLLLEHPPVLTLGRGAHATNIVASVEVLAREGVARFDTDRGGDVTYHGPGQRVGYPLLFLPPGEQDVRRYVRRLEEVIIRTVAEWGLTAQRIEKWPGVWMNPSRHGGPRKICALGVHLSRWYSRHGFALNVATNLKHFELIVPCGISEAGVTSMEAELGQPVDLAAVDAALERHFAEVFEAQLTPAPPPTRTVSVTVVAPGPRVLLLRRVPARGAFWQLVTGHVEASETPADAAQRELVEETGFASRVTPLDYVHSFAFGQPRRGPPEPGDERGPMLEAPRVGQETAFVAHVDAPGALRLSAEHDAHEWLSPDEALARLPFEGLRVAVRRATTA